MALSRPQTHPRKVEVSNAQIAIAEAVGRAVEKYHLTDNELINILAQQITTFTHYAIRGERDVEHAVRTVGDALRQELQQPFTGEPRDDVEQDPTAQVKIVDEFNVGSFKPKTKCRGLMDKEQINTCKEMGVEPSECCPRAGEYNGYGSGPLKFTCTKEGGCPCHD